MGFVATVRAFARTVIAGAQAPEVTVDRDGDETATAHHFGAPGDDAVPLPGDVAYLGDDAGAGAAQSVAYQDPTTAGVAAAGERRIYSRSAPGVMAAEVWCKADGTIVLRNASGARLELDAAGNVTVAAQSELRLGGDGASAFVALANLVLARLQAIHTAVNAHVHVSAAPGSPTGPAVGSFTPPDPPPAGTILPATPASVAASKAKAQ